MTTIYFVRHAQPDYGWKDDRTRPLTEAGERDSERVYEVLRDVELDYAVSSPYKRTVDTIRHCADCHRLEIHTDERFRERESGEGGNRREMIRRRWADFDYHEEGGESLHVVQMRNIEGLLELLGRHEGEKLLVGTHGTALSTILNYYDPSYGHDNYIRMIDYMPYIIRLDFEDGKCMGKEELLIVEKEFIDYSNPLHSTTS